MKKVREKVAIAVAIASITTISSFVISNGKKVYAEEVRVTATSNVDNIKNNGKQLKNESPKANTQEDTNVKNEDLKTDEKKDIKEVESNFVKNVENKTEKINEDKSLENNNNKVATKLESSDKDVKEIKNDKDSKDKDSKEVKDENIEKVHNKKDTVEEVENKSNQNNEDKINRDKKVEVKSEEIKSKDNETSKRDEESKKIKGENKEVESKLDKNKALKSDYININESGQALTVGTESQNNSATDENKKDGWQTIGGKTYYFENGKVSTGKKEVYDTKNGEYKTYFFNEDGALVTDTGIHDYCESWGGKRKVYVNNKGEVENGWKTIDGKTYYFDKYEGMIIGASKVQVGNKNEKYLFDKDGVLVKGSGWKSINGRWYYFNNDNSLVEGWQKINGKDYYFNYDGEMANGILYINGQGKREVYLFDNNGSLVKGNGWKEIDRKWYYFNDNNSLANGWKTINGKTYYFNSHMMVGATEVYNQEDSKYQLYYFKRDGSLINKKGWEKLNGNWYYFNDDSSLKTKWQTIGGKTYYFDERTGVMATGQKTIYDDFDHVTRKYCFTSDGTLLEKRGWLYKSNGYKKVWCYIEENGSLKTGWGKINGNEYYFNYNGEMETGIVDVRGNLGFPEFYCFDSNGELFKKEGWKKINEKWYYVNKDGSLFKGWKKSGDDWYYLIPEFGEMATRPQKASYDRNLGFITYYFEEDGKLTKRTGWISNPIEDFNYWYYIEDGGKAALGWKKINGTWYYFDSDARMVTAPTRIFDKESSKEKIYFFDKNGAYRKYSGWYEYNHRTSYADPYWYYFGEDGFAKIGWKTINGNKYYFSTEGKMYIGPSNVLEDKDDFNRDDLPIYFFNQNGALVNSEGWQKIYWHYEDRWCYIDSTGLCKKGLAKINNKFYYFDPYSGIMQTGIISVSGIKGDKKINCFFDDSGALNTSKGWHDCKEKYTYRKTWCYIFENGDLADGLMEIDGNKYYFEDGTVKIGFAKIDDKEYYFNDYGVMVIGWSQNKDGEYYYTDNNGILLQKGWQKINGIWYYFNDCGVMATGPKYILDENTYDTKLYYFDNSGALQYKKGWVNHIGKYNNDWYYINSNNELSTGWQNINGTWYYFRENGKMAKGSTAVTYSNGDKRYYCFDNSGAWVTNPGWHSWQNEFNNTCWAYINNDGSLAEGWKDINNKLYYFHKERKVMAKGAVKEWDYKTNKPYIQHFFNEDGSWDASEGWKSFNKLSYSPDLKWAYVESNGILASGWKKLGGQWYYFDESTGIMVTEKRYIDGNLYEFNSNGTLKN
ncbi:cell wall-binding protein [Clostridium perfringens]|uniref:cell wall-binding protein n=1 Tax=Clostridium perfringens TaxID=1502 RepID=UPI0032DA2D92